MFGGHVVNLAFKIAEKTCTIFSESLRSKAETFFTHFFDGKKNILAENHKERTNRSLPGFILLRKLQVSYNRIWNEGEYQLLR